MHIESIVSTLQIMPRIPIKGTMDKVYILTLSPQPYQQNGSNNRNQLAYFVKARNIFKCNVFHAQPKCQYHRYYGQYLCQNIRLKHLAFEMQTNINWKAIAETPGIHTAYINTLYTYLHGSTSPSSLAIYHRAAKIGIIREITNYILRRTSYPCYKFT